MEQEAGQGIGIGEIGGDRNQQPQRQRQPPPPQQPQQCPRCESLNTKFCYYNNYSLSQPRFFCKACKRYWTQGGTLRNIPIGGASRKGKRSKGSSSSSTMSSSSGLQPQPQSEPQSQQSQQTQPQSRPQQVTQEVVHLQNQPNLTTLMRPTPPRVVQPTSPYYRGGGIGGGGGYLSSLAAVHSMNPPQQPLNQSLNVVASSNSDLLSGFNTNVSASLGSQQHHHPGQIRSPRFYPIGNNRVVESLLRPEHGFNVPSNMANNVAASRPDHWPQSFTNNANHRAPDTSLWSTVSTTSSISGNTQNNTRGSGSSSLIPNHWPNLPGNDSPYQ